MFFRQGPGEGARVPRDDHNGDLRIEGPKWCNRFRPTTRYLGLCLHDCMKRWAMITTVMAVLAVMMRYVTTPGERYAHHCIRKPLRLKLLARE
jgi:hypothetical protein